MTPEFNPPNLAPRRASWELPAGACDTHVHIFGPFDAFPLAEPRTYTPAAAPIEDHETRCLASDIRRAVLVQPSVYGTDNGAMLAALEGHPDRLRGVAVPNPSISDEDLASMHHAGVRGIRINPRFPGGVGLDDIADFAERIRHMGWHIQIIPDPATLARDIETLLRTGLPVVVDHMGHDAAALDIESESGNTFLDFCAAPDIWIKLSAPYLLAYEPPHYGRVLPLMQAIAEAAPDRSLWGSNWPHPGVPRPMPEEGDLLDLLLVAAGSVDRAARILVENPAKLYGFGEGTDI